MCVSSPWIVLWVEVTSGGLASWLARAAASGSCSGSCGEDSAVCSGERYLPPGQFSSAFSTDLLVWKETVLPSFLLGHLEHSSTSRYLMLLTQLGWR